MIYVPFIYFSILLILIIRKNKAFDVSAALVSLYALSSFFAILIDVLDLYNEILPNIEIHFLPTFIYCFLLSLTIYPFYKFKSHKINDIIILRNQKLFDYVVYFYFSIFVILIVFYAKDIIFRLAYGNFRELRIEIQKGTLLTAQHSFSGIKRYLSIIAGVFAEGSLFMILFYFYSITFLRKSKAFNLLILFGSFSVILLGIIGLDRSRTIYYILVFYLMVVFFRPFMNKQQKRKIVSVVIIFGSLIITYFVLVTISRFGIRYSGTSGGIITYVGQPFINFCNFIDNLNFKTLSYNYSRVLPLMSDLFIESNARRFGYYHSGIEMAVFSTYIGMLMSDIGRVGAFAYSIMYYFIARHLLHRKKLDFISFDQLLIFFILVLVPLIGVLVYYYSNPGRIISLLFFLIIAFSLRYKIAY